MIDLRLYGSPGWTFSIMAAQETDQIGGRKQETGK